MAPDPILDYANKVGPSVPVGVQTVLTGRQLAALACRVIALWIFAGTVEQAVSLVYEVVVAFGALGSRGSWTRQPTDLAFGLLLIAGPLATGTYLWFGSDRLATRMVPDDAAAVPAGGPGYKGLLSIGLAVAGAIMLSSAVRSLAGAVAEMSLSHGRFADWRHDPFWVRQFWSGMAGLAVTAWLLFGGRGIANLIVWARTAGRPVEPPAHAGP